MLKISFFINKEEAFWNNLSSLIPNLNGINGILLLNTEVLKIDLVFNYYNLFSPSKSDFQMKMVIFRSFVYLKSTIV